MSVVIGATCKLYKTCKICRKTKYFNDFKPMGGRKRNPGARRSYCRNCTDRKHERILSSTVEYSFMLDTLDPSKDIVLRGRSAENHKYEKVITYEIAKLMVEEGAVGIVHSTLLHHFYSRKSFRRFIFNRDNYQCHYCGQYGNTVDHKLPKSKGGLNTPNNCVCACYICNKKGNTLYEDYLKEIQVNHVKG